MVYTESDLIIPALRLLDKNRNGLTTSELIELLNKKMKPSGHDAEILSGRNDTYFSQKVRNLIGSHRNLEGKGLATFQNSVSRITPKGLRFIRKNEAILVSLSDQGFKETDIETAVERDLSGIITEGMLDRRTIDQRKRSERLRRIAIKQFRTVHDNKVFCEVCNFDFSEVYGDHGLGFIEVHHKTPIHKMDLSGTTIQLQRALKQVILLCSNCHRMIHREKGRMLSIDDLRAIIQS